VVTAREEEVGGAETHEMDLLEPHTGSAASSLQSVNAQDINEAQPVISQVEGVTSIWTCCPIQRRLFCSVTDPRPGPGPEFHMHFRSDDVNHPLAHSPVPNITNNTANTNNNNNTTPTVPSPHTTSDRLTQAEAQTCTCFLTIVEISMT
jgi:hypothetical protein